MKRYLLRFKGLFLVTICLTILCAVLDVYIAFILSDIVDASISKDMQIFKNSIIIAVIYLIINISGNFLQRIVKALYLKKTLVVLKKDLFSKILTKDMINFKDENTASYISTLTNDEAIIENDYFDSIIQLIYYLVSFAISFYSLIKINYNLILAIIIGGTLTLIVPQLFSGKLSNSRKMYSNNMSAYTSKLKDMFSGFEVIKGFNIEDKAVNDFNRINETTEKSKYRFSIISSMVDMLSGFFGSILHISVMMVGVYLSIKDKITIGEMIAAVQLMNYIINPFVQGIMIKNKINSTKDIANKMLKIIENKEDDTAYLSKVNFEKNIILDNLSFSYNEEKSALDRISLSFEKGKKYAVIGGSGSGKSTLLKLILGYYRNYTGKINIDNLDIKNISPGSRYELMCSIHQTVYLFDGTIKENIALYKDYSEKELDKAIDLADLRELINSLPKGIYTYVGENGKNLSGGEKQRVSIARAIIKKTPILLLDEATSALDAESANSIENTIFSLKNCTSVVITHRLSEDILKQYDEIIVMKEGRIVEQGDFRDLLNKKKHFYNMFYLEKQKDVEEICL